jgi:hypothetical protein
MQLLILLGNKDKPYTKMEEIGRDEGCGQE